MQRLSNLEKIVVQNPKIDGSKFYKLSVEERRNILSESIGHPIDHDLLNKGGINVEQA